MAQIKRFVFSFVLIVLGAGALTLIAPRAARATASLLVQVTNTASSPAVTEGVDKQFAQLVDLGCFVGFGNTVNCSLVNPSGSGTSPYSLPASGNLVITSVDMTLLATDFSFSPCIPTKPEVVQLNLVSGGVTSTRNSWGISSSGTTHYAYPSGIALASNPGVSTAVSVTDVGVSNCGGASIELRGYVTSN